MHDRLARLSDTSDSVGATGDAVARGPTAQGQRSGALEDSPGAPRGSLRDTGPLPEVPPGPEVEEAAPPRAGEAGPSLETPSRGNTNERTSGVRRAQRARRAAEKSAWSQEKRERWYRETNKRLAGALERAGLNDDAERVARCGQQRLLVDPHGHTRWGKEQCEHRLCPRCARRRAKKQSRAWADAASRVPQRRGYRWRFITLTLKVGSTQGRLFGLESGTQDLIADFVRLKDCFARLRRRWRNRWDGLAGFYSLEVGASVTGRNVHLHMLVYAPWMPQAELADEWEALTGDSRVVDVRAVRDVKGGMVEIAKYITKLTLKRDMDELVAIHIAMRGKPTGRAFGLAHGMIEIPVTDPVACLICDSTTWYYVADSRLTADGERLATEMELLAQSKARAGPPLADVAKINDAMRSL